MALSLIFVGIALIRSVPTQAAELNPELTAGELKYESFSDQELKSMGFVNGIGKIIIYNAKQKAIWNARVEKARENVAIAKKMHRKPNARDLYLIERDEQIKNPPKKPFVEKWFGKSTTQMIQYFKSGQQPPDAKFVFGSGLTLSGLLMLVKILAPLGV
ncbi:hypothetical protein REC12_11655 [Desulfosporosinus sp. PR]|uniref:hypothetical protein n=1 Tax=Candidatus Desulfosporosinus nitrosoreducens TaxID=3401928 RepID=UPI0027E7A3A3|nr:hypothetical protein [Desulfosporosinus sp. PR]MDQ7094245.1 hypothetical protein [Desulfosporosinus sp. PR]